MTWPTIISSGIPIAFISALADASSGSLALGSNVPKGTHVPQQNSPSFFEHVVGEGYELRRDIRSQERRTFATASPTAAIVALRSSVEAGEFVR